MGLIVAGALLAVTLAALRIRLALNQPPNVIGSAVSGACLTDIQIRLGRTNMAQVEAL